MIAYLSSLRSVPRKHLSDRQQYDVDSLVWCAEKCEDEDVVQAVSHCPLGEVFRLRRGSYGVRKLLNMAHPRNLYNVLMLDCP
jgi:hypothetical protein